MSTSILIAGAPSLACIYCGCTEDNACLLDGDGRSGVLIGHPCAWLQTHPPVCSAADCTSAAFIAGTATPRTAAIAMRSTMQWAGLL